MFKFHTFLRRNRILAILLGVGFLLLVFFLASRINLEEDVSNLIPAGGKQDLLKKVLAQTEVTDKIIVTISSENKNKKNPEVLISYAHRFIDSVNTNIPKYVKSLQGKVPDEGIREVYNFVYQNLPLFLNDTDYKSIQNKLDVDSIAQRLEEDYKILISPTGLVTKDFLFKDPLSITGLGLQKLRQLQVGDNFELYHNFLFTKDRNHLLLFINPVLPASETNQNQDFVNKLDKILNGLNSENKDVKGEYFGGLLYSLANANQIKSDIQLTIGIAVVILLILLIVYYRKFYVPILLFIPSIIGACTALAILYLFKGTISAISVGIGAILLGISVDYALHILTHYKNNNNLKQLYKDITIPVIMSSGTTAIAFLCLLFVKSKALNDLGLFAAISVVVASIAALIITPLLYKAPKTKAIQRNTLLDRFAAIEFHKKKPLVVLVFLMFIAGLFFFTKVTFNNDLSAINFVPKKLKQTENRVQEVAGKAAKSVYLVSYGNTVDEALEHNNKLYNRLEKMQKKGNLNSFSSIGGVVLSTSAQQQKIEKWNNFWTVNRKNLLKKQLIEKSANYGFKPESFNQFYDLLSKNFEPILLKDYRKTSNLYMNDFISKGNNFATVTTSLDLPENQREQVLKDFHNDKNIVVIDRQQLNESFLGNLKNDFNKLILYSIIAVFLILLISYRSLILSFLTILPIGVTWVIALGFMAVFNIEFNILNIIISTFIFGLGLDYSIFITNAFLKEYETGTKVLKTYRTSILLSVITTLLGIGALFFAQHPALRSISLVSVIGVLSAVIVAFVLQGFLFDYFFLKRIKKGKPAINFKNLVFPGKKYKGDKLYYKREVLDNYRYKSVFPEIKNHFYKNRERFLKLSGFIDETDSVAHFNSGCGVLAVYLNYKKQEVPITGLEANLKNIQIAKNCFAVYSGKLHFQKKVEEDTPPTTVFIISKPKKAPIFEEDLTRLIPLHAQKVIILDSEYNYRWILDLNFEISYRQNDVVLLQKLN